MSETAKCKACGGCGTYGQLTCKDCNGTGELSDVKPIQQLCLKCAEDCKADISEGYMTDCTMFKEKPKADVKGVVMDETKCKICGDILIFNNKYGNYDECNCTLKTSKYLLARLTALQSAHEEEVKELKNRIELAEDALWDMWEQHAYTGKSKGKDIIYTGGLSANESCEGYFLRYNLIDDTGHKITRAMSDVRREGK